MSEDVYRSCASIAVFRQADEGFELLLVHKPRKNDAWQLPQGGCEHGETIEQAAAREVKEEAGIEPEVLHVSDHVYQYDFPKSFRRFRPDNICGQRIEYVFATIDPDVQVQVDGEEIDDFTWVTKQELGKYLKRKEYHELVKKIYADGTALLKIEN